MLWFNKIRLVVVIGGLLALGACGFRPLYNQPPASGESRGYNVQIDMATIYIKPIKDRIGQQLHNLLLTRLNPSGSPAEPAYKLTITLFESVQELGIQKSSFASRANLRISARYNLVPVDGTGGDGAAGTTGDVLAISSYDISTYEFSTLTARKDARKRAVREIADDLKTRFAVYFAQNRK